MISPVQIQWSSQSTTLTLVTQFDMPTAPKLNWRRSRIFYNCNEAPSPKLLMRRTLVPRREVTVSNLSCENSSSSSSVTNVNVLERLTNVTNVYLLAHGGHGHTPPC